MASVGLGLKPRIQMRVRCVAAESDSVRTLTGFSTYLTVTASLFAITWTPHSLLSAQKFEGAHIDPVAGGLQQAAAGDFNNDGFDDVAITVNSNSGAGSVSVLLAGPNGLAQPVRYASNGVVNGIAVDDFRQDGKPDIAVVGSKGVNILLGNGDGTFQAAVLYPVKTYLQASDSGLASRSRVPLAPLTHAARTQFASLFALGRICARAAFFCAL